MNHGAHFMTVFKDPKLEISDNQVVGLNCVLYLLPTRVLARHVVVATGSWRNRFLPPDSQLPLRAVKGQYLELSGCSLIQRVIRTPGAYLVPRGNGTIYVGATSEEKGFDNTTLAGPLFELFGQAWRVVPGIYESRIKLTSAGLRPALRDNLPAIGPTDVVGLSVMTGHYRHGIMLAPLSGLMMAKLIEGDDGGPFADVFSPLRFKKDQAHELTRAS